MPENYCPLRAHNADAKVIPEVTFPPVHSTAPPAPPPGSFGPSNVSLRRERRLDRQDRESVPQPEREIRDVERANEQAARAHDRQMPLSGRAHLAQRRAHRIFL